MKTIRVDENLQTYLEVIARTAAACSLSIDDILGKRRTAPIAAARQLACYFLRTKFPLSYPEIGAILDRDHTTIIHNVRSVEATRRDEAETLWGSINEIESGRNDEGGAA